MYMEKKMDDAIKFKDISVIVQGAVTSDTKKTFESIREYLPGATIILSTWKESKTDDLGFDYLVINEDPGAFPCDKFENSIINNVNRQIVSTNGGLKLCHTKYAIKMRTDFYLTGNRFVSYFKNEESFDKNWQFLNERVIACTLYSRNPRSNIKMLCMPYCVSDFFYFGYTEDIRELFDIDLVSSLDEKMYFEIHPEEESKLVYKPALCRFMPEQTIWMGFVKKHVADLDCSCRDHLTPKNIEITERTIANNVSLYSYENLEIDTFSENLFKKGIPENCFTRSDWLELYKYYCEGGTERQFRRYIKQVERREIKKVNKQDIVESLPDSEIKYEEIDNLYDVVKRVDKEKYISFDLFDTLIFRRVFPYWQIAAQTGEYASMLLKSYGYDVSSKRFNDLRDYFAEIEYQQNKKRGLSRECRLDEVISNILAYIGVSERDTIECSRLIYENEVEREIIVTYPNSEALKTLKELKRRGYVIIVASDMYLRKDSIERVIEANGLLSFIDHVYVSSESGKVKADGKLFEYIIDDLKTNSNELIHIGDNKLADVYGASKANLQPYYYHKEDNTTRLNDLNEQFIGAKFKEYVSKNLRNTDATGTFQKSVSDYYSFDFINFVFDFAIKIQKQGAEAVYFLERDGVIFKTIYEIIVRKCIIFKDIDVKPTFNIKISRKDSACLTNLDSIDEVIERATKVNYPGRFHIIHLVGCYGVSINDFDEEDQIAIVNNNSNRAFFLKEYRRLFYPKLKQRQDEVISQLSNMRLFEKKNIAIIDIGWGGTSQKDIQKYIERAKINMTIFGYYYACDDRARQLIPYYSQYNYGPDLYYGYSLIEFLVKNYSDNGKKQMADTYKYNKMSRDQIISDVDIFCCAVNKYSLTPQIIRDVTYKRVQKAITAPELSLLNEIKNVRYSLDRRRDDAYLPLFEKVETISELNKQYTNAQWVQASIEVSDMDFKKYLKKKADYDRMRELVHMPECIKQLLLKFIRYKRSISKYER